MMPMDFAAETPVTFTVKVTESPADAEVLLGVMVTVAVCAAIKGIVNEKRQIAISERRRIFFIKSYSF
jgi:hypothetical protein